MLAVLLCCLASVADAQAVCKDWTCQVSHLVVPKTKNDLIIADANATVTAAECGLNPDWVNSTDSTIFWEDCACGCSGPVRVALVALLGIMVFYIVVIFLFVSGITILRSGPAKEYEDLKAAGKVREDAEEIGGESATAWMSKSEDQIRTEVRRIATPK